MNKNYNYCPFCKGNLETKKTQPDGTLRQICQECGYVFYQNPSPTVSAIIEKDDQLLLIKRKFEPNKGCWDLPGGFVEIGQNLEDALASEVKEEIGIGIKSSRYFCSTVSFYNTEYMIENIVGIAFKVEVDSYDFVPGSDAQEVKFFNKNNLPKIAAFDDVQLTIQKLIQENKL